MKDISQEMAVQEYYSFFGFKEDPFSPSVNPEYLYFSPGYKECFYRLIQSVENRHGITLICGEPGFGKTSIAMAFTAYASRRKNYELAYFDALGPQMSPFSLLETISRSFGVDERLRSTGAAFASISSFLKERENSVFTVVIDEAQNLRSRHLETIRLLQNIETPRMKLLNLVLLAQPEIVKALKRKRNFLQRVSTVYTFAPLDRKEARGLINYRMKRAGGGRSDVFTPGALEQVIAHATGVPRVLVTCCRNAMILAARVNERKITPELVDYSIEETTLKMPE